MTRPVVSSLLVCLECDFTWEEQLPEGVHPDREPGVQCPRCGSLEFDVDLGPEAS